MRLLGITTMIACCTLLFSGKYREVEVYQDNIVICHGDRFYEVIEPYYDKCDKRYITWDEYRTVQKDINKKLFKNGRALQPGDIVAVEWYKFKE